VCGPHDYTNVNHMALGGHSVWHACCISYQGIFSKLIYILWLWGEVLWSGSRPYFQAIHFPSSILCCISLQSPKYCTHCNVASGWVAYGILKQCQCTSLVTWQQAGISVFQVTSTCRAKSRVIWGSHKCAAENASHLWCDVMSFIM
jgi:hypothetical protein